MIRLDLTKRVGTLTIALKLAVGTGVTALFGPSGAGKTSIAHMVAGLVKPDSGVISVSEQIFFDSGRRINLPPEKRHLGYVFQEGRLFPHLSVRKNLSFGTKYLDLGLFERTVALLGIESILDRHPKMLSGGEKQRVAIGRALLADPHILIMDEPLSSLDEPRKAEIMPVLSRLVQETRIPILYISHSMAEIERLADRMVLLDQGRQTGLVEFARDPA